MCVYICICVLYEEEGKNNQVTGSELTILLVTLFHQIAYNSCFSWPLSNRNPALPEHLYNMTPCNAPPTLPPFSLVHMCVHTHTHTLTFNHSPNKYYIKATHAQLSSITAIPEYIRQLTAGKDSLPTSHAIHQQHSS